MKFNLIQQKLFLVLAAGIAAVLGFFAYAAVTHAATFSVTPPDGTYTVGSTFEVSVVLDTKGKEVNAVQVELSFPPDKLQLVSPSTGSSIISIYTTPPKYDNAAGKIQIIGGIPNGINVSAGLISKLTFRVKGVGTAALRFAGESQILLNDGRGTNVLDNTTGASYKLELPPQQGPLIISDSHPDQEAWYKNSEVSLRWDVGLPPAENYSYTISNNPTDIPDDTPEGSATSVEYKKAPDGINYFSIKAFRDGAWGGVSRYSLRIDTIAPDRFTIEISPNKRTFITKPFFQFSSKDALSGIDHYEVKILPLKVEGRPKAAIDDQLFVEAESPYHAPELLMGTYQVIIRAYDQAGNIREEAESLVITDSWLWFLSEDGITLPFGKQAPWSIVLPVFGGLLLLLLLLAYIVRRLYKRAHKQVVSGQLPDTIQSQLEELQKYRARYGKLAAMFLLIFVVGVMFVQAAPVFAIEPPVIETYSQHIKDDELFYVSGRTVDPNTEVVLHVQSLVDGAAFDFTIQSDKRGDWTYRHDSFLAGGKYLVWAHAKDGEQLSVPSPQSEMDVKPVAVSWGGSRITYQSIYVGMIGGLIGTVILLLIYIIIHALLLRRRRRMFGEQLRHTEDTIKRGFAVLYRDIEAELQLMKQAQLSQELSGEAKVREEQLRQDMQSIEDLVGQEILQVEKFEKLPT